MCLLNFRFSSTLICWYFVWVSERIFWPLIQKFRCLVKTLFFDHNIITSVLHVLRGISWALSQCIMLFKVKVYFSVLCFMDLIVVSIICKVVCYYIMQDFLFNFLFIGLKIAPYFDLKRFLLTKCPNLASTPFALFYIVLRKPVCCLNVRFLLRIICRSFVWLSKWIFWPQM